MRIFCVFISVSIPRENPGGAKPAWAYLKRASLGDFSDDAGADRAAALANGEAKLLLHRDRHDKLDRNRDIVARHDHLSALGQADDAGHVRGAEVELRTIVGEERRVTAALFLGEDIGLSLELGVRLDGAGLAQHLAALDVLALGAAQQTADVVASLALIEQLTEHLDAGDDRLRRRLEADDLDFLPNLDDAALD